MVYDLEKLALVKKRLNALAEANKGLHLTDVFVVYSGPEGGKAEDRLALFGRNCATRVAALLKNVETCAVAWGRTIESVVSGIKAFGPPSPNHKMQFMPLSGEPINYPAPGMSSSAAAEILAAAFQPKGLEPSKGSVTHYNRAFSLRGVGVRIPKTSQQDAEAIRRFVMHCNDYREIFREPERPISKVGAIITGLGDANTSENDPWFSETLDAEGLRDHPEKLRDMAIGNIGGVWFAKTKDYEMEVQAMNDRWLGIKKEDFDNCVRLASGGGNPKHPGVIVVAIGKTKKRIVERVAGMANYFVIDTTLADAIIEGSSTTSEKK
jgi:DNA-binding transcriptional regulator LsrR (DeoR family)